jgi:MYXO-CTERM domain-containing protein
MSTTWLRRQGPGWWGLTLVAMTWPSTAGATRLWDGDASKGLTVFGEVQSLNGPITVADDPTYGKVFKFVCNDNGATKARSEVSYMAGVTLDPKNGDYFIAWRSKWGPLPTKAGKWQVLSQIHHDPVGLGGPVPFGLSVPGDGKMHFNAQDPTGRSYSMWDHALPLDEWHRYIVHTKMGETLATGYCEIWFDGVKQTLTNGQDRIGCAMSRPNAGSHWKWGVYRSGAGGPIGQSVHYLQHPMMGTTLEDVLDDSGPAAPGDGGATTADAGAEADAAEPAADTALASPDTGASPAKPDARPSYSGGAGGSTPSSTETDRPRSAKSSGGCSVGGPAWPSVLLLLALPLLRRRRR